MISPVKGSELAEQIELARRSIDRWPGWLKEAAGINGTDVVEPTPAQNSPSTVTQASNPDPEE